MKNIVHTSRLAFRTLTYLLLLLWLGPGEVWSRVVDNFDDNAKTDWKDFTFQAGFGLPTETGGRFRFEQPAAGTAIFSASQKTSESFELKEGRTIEMKVDVVKTGAKDSFAVLAFIPTANSPGTLSGYGLAKSTTDVLMTKGINRYFLAESWPPAGVPDAASENITLVLRMKAVGGNVEVTGRILDKGNNNAVLWEKTVIDTPNADLVVPQGDQPKEPFLASGYFTLYLYQDFDRNAPENPYVVEYDNAEVRVSETVTVDDFNDNTKTDWKDFTFQPGFGLPAETGGQFKFTQPPAGTAIFSASQKTSRTFDLTEGEELEFRVDVDQTGAKDSFAVLAFIPTANSPGTLSGYGLAKSTTDVLMTKGINRYFVVEGWPPNDKPEAPSQNITLVISMVASNGNVRVTGSILDKSNNNALLWQRSIVDTPAADLVVPQGDQPKEPFITSGYFTLYLYQDFDRNAPEDPYIVVYDNAVATTPPVAANTAPVISDVAPLENGNFIPASAPVSFKASDDKPLESGKFTVSLNGTNYTSANGLTLSADGQVRTATLAGKLAANQNYTALLQVEDSNGEKTQQIVYFDTFETNNLVVEIEEYNFDSGNFMDRGALAPESPGISDPVAGSYRNQLGTEGIDFHDTRTTPRVQDALYRASDPIRMARSIDYLRAKFAQAGGNENGFYDYDVGDIVIGEWLNYTRTFTPGSYEVYLRQSTVNMATSDAALELVTSSRAQADQTTRPLGSFLGTRTGFKYRNVPLTDGTGTNKVVLRLSGETTLRLRQNTTDPEGAGLRQNYLIFIPVADPGLQRAAISTLFPAPGSQVESVNPVLRVEIQNRDTSAKANSVKLEVNGQVVSPVVTTNATGLVLTYALTPLPPAGSTNTAKITFLDNFDIEISSAWSFVVNYRGLEAATRAARPGGERGFKIRVVQAPVASNLENSLQRAESQLAPNSPIPQATNFTGTAQIINYNKREGDAGAIPGDVIVPGLDVDNNGDNDFTMEVLAWLELPAGVTRFGAITDDGYKLNATTNSQGPILAFHDGGPANETFDIVAPVAGLYPLRFVWYERGGAAYAEWFTVDEPSGERILINDSANAKAIKAYHTLGAAPEIELLSANSVTEGFAIVAATLDVANKKVSIAKPGANRFFKLRFNGTANANTRVRITRIVDAGANLDLSYEVTN